MRRLLDTEQLNELKIVLEDDYPAFIDSFILDTEKKLAQLQVLLTQHSFRDGRDVAHSLKGSCLNLGAAEMAECCQRLQLIDSDSDSNAQIQLLQSTWADTKVQLSALII
ncbi:MAG: Hpt domain-containing protein [Pseudomonadota bacterium]